MADATPLVSFVVPCFNYGRYLPDCLDSIFAQQGGHSWEVVLVDDGSTDDTRQVIARYRDPRVRLIIHPQNQGHVATINDGLAATRGRYVARIDPDDRYRPYFLDTVLPKLEAYPEVGLVYGDVSMIDERGQGPEQGCDRVHGGGDYKGNELVALLAKNFICAPTVIARREAWVRCLPVPEGLAFHDWYFTILMAREHEFYYVNRLLADYRVHGQNHHTLISRTGTEEKSTLWLLDRVFAETEKSAALEREKRRARRHIYATQYLTFGTKYFGHQMDADSRRCYLKALQYAPLSATNPVVLRHLLATVVGRKAYEASKALAKRLLHGSPG